MNAYQMAQQIKKRLQTVVWPTGVGEVVFGTRGVVITAGVPTEEQIPPGFPWAMVSMGRGTPDDENPTLVVQPFSVYTACEVAGDPHGQSALIGGAIASDGIGRSANRGVLEVAERVHAALATLTGADGAPITLVLSGPGAPQSLGRGKHMVLHEHEVKALVTTERTYDAPQNTRVSGASLLWNAAHCRERFDYLHTKVVEKVGSYPQSVTDGTVIYTGNADTTAGLTAGRYYAVFVGYDSRGGSTAEAYSALEVGTYKVA